jgi:hypothetical protein
LVYLLGFAPIGPRLRAAIQLGLVAGRRWRPVTHLAGSAPGPPGQAPAEGGLSGAAARLTGIARAGHELRPAEWCTDRPVDGRSAGLVLPGAAGAVDTAVGDGNVLEPTAAQRRADIVRDLAKEGLHEVPTADAGLPSKRGARPSPCAWTLSTHLLVVVQR